MKKLLNILASVILLLTTVSFACFYFKDYFAKGAAAPELVDTELALIGLATFITSLLLTSVACGICLLTKQKV